MEIQMKLMEWLEQEAKGITTVLGFVVLAALIDASVNYAITGMLENWHVVKVATDYSNPFEYESVFSLGNVLLIGPMFEEVFFRLLPLGLVIMFVSKSPKVVFGAMITFAVIFGAAHPYAIFERANIAVAGLMFGLVFLKCGGMEKRFFKATAASIAAHGVSNLFVYLYGYWLYREMKG